MQPSNWLKFKYILFPLLTFSIWTITVAQAHKYRGLPKSKSVLQYAKNLSEAYSPREVAKLQENETHAVYQLYNADTRFAEHLLFYRKCDSTIVEDVDIRKHDPYKDYRRFGKVRDVINADKNDLPARLVDNLSEAVIDRMPHISTNNAAYSPCYQCPIVMKYSYSFFPNEEILEHISYPGLTSFMVFDNYSGRVLYDLKEFPFALLEFPAITHGSKYLAAGHMEMVSHEAKYLPYEDYFSMASILNMETGEVCFTDVADDIYGTAINGDNGYIYLIKETDSNLPLLRFLIQDSIYSLEFPARNVEFFSNKIIVKHKDTRPEEYYFNIDFNIAPLCR
ncbi:hypothetical protein CEQ90_17100 [Lewinellaceae bacterium SD302]|nr:hypothetical protein CEQ90_17100 [Lewinellaceae bacterium SD302]